MSKPSPGDTVEVTRGRHKGRTGVMGKAFKDGRAIVEMTAPGGGAMLEVLLLETSTLKKKEGK